MVVLPKLICRSSAVSIIFAEIDKQILKYTWKCKGLRTARNNEISRNFQNFSEITVLQQKKVRGLLLLGFKTVWYQHKARCIDHWDRFDSPEINPYICGQTVIFMIFAKGTEAFVWGNDSLFNRWCLDSRICTYKKKTLTSHHK